MRNYIKLPALKPMSDSRKILSLLSDKTWKQYIFYFLLKYYKEVKEKEVITLIWKESENQKSRANIETAIKKHICHWLKNCPVFDRHQFIVNLEPSAEGYSEGFYDLKFEHSQWRKKYFSFEAKNLGKTKSLSSSKSIKEYVYTKEKRKGKYVEDGGMYRYFIGKYACEMKFGGMIGFIVGKIETPIAKLISKIYSVYDNNLVGKLTKKKIIKNSISGNHNTFDSIHLRQNIKTKKDEEFWLHHILMDFTYSEK